MTNPKALLLLRQKQSSISEPNRKKRKVILMDDFDWSPFESDRWSPDTIGDELVGKLTDISVVRIGSDDIPELTVVAGGRTLTVRPPTDLRFKLAAAKPQVGDKIAMKLVDLKSVGQPQPMKIFALKVAQADNSAVPAEDPEAPF